MEVVARVVGEEGGIQETPLYSRSSRAATDSCEVCALHKGTWPKVGVRAEV